MGISDGIKIIVDIGIGRYISRDVVRDSLPRSSGGGSDGEGMPEVRLRGYSRS